MDGTLLMDESRLRSKKDLIKRHKYVALQKRQRSDNNESILEQVQNENKRKKLTELNELTTYENNNNDNNTDDNESIEIINTDSRVSTADAEDITYNEVQSILGVNYTIPNSIKEEIIELFESFPNLNKIYEIYSKIGEGTFSSVYLGKERKVSRFNNNHDNKRNKTSSLVALKKIYVTSSPQRIFNELNLLYILRGNENVAPLLDVLRYEDQVIAVLPYYKHSDFRDFYRDLPLIGIKNYMFDLFQAIEFIHKHDVIHRDIKPTNFLYNPFTGKGVLVDFGLAEKYEPVINNACPCINGGFNDEEISKFEKLSVYPKNGYLKDDQRPGRRANRAGTRGFRAPEVLFKCNCQTPLIDIWSAGVMLLTLLSRRFPFFNSTDDIEAIMELINIYGTIEMKECANLHGLNLDCNIPKMKNKISFSAIIANSILMDCKEGDTFAEDSPAWEILSVIDKRGRIIDNKLGNEYNNAIDLLEKSMELYSNKRENAENLLKHEFFKEFRTEVEEEDEEGYANDDDDDDDDSDVTNDENNTP